MVPYYGRHPVKQFIRGKPIRWGYKAWVAATRLGYVFFWTFIESSEEHFLDEDGQIILVRWCDNGVASIASNQHGLQPIKRVERYCAFEKKKINVQMPNLISKYNQNMGGVDCVDENIEHHQISVRGKNMVFSLFIIPFQCLREQCLAVCASWKA